jgi:hypothetical protein
MVTGRLEGTCAGQPVVMNVNGRNLSVQVNSLSSAWALRKNFSDATLPGLHFLIEHGATLTLKIGRLWSLRVLPCSGLLSRLLLSVS